MADKRPEELVAFGYIPCQFESETKLLRTRKLRSAREWKQRFAQEMGSTIASFELGEGADSVAAIAALGNLGSEVILNLVVEYDTSGSLGGREWLEEHADDREVYAVLRAVLDVHFPFVKDVMGAMREIGSLMASVPTARAVLDVNAPDPSATENSSNGASPIGVEVPTS
jgi:hypothetical protein